MSKLHILFAIIATISLLVACNSQNNESRDVGLIDASKVTEIRVLRLMAAIKLFELGKLSSGSAAQLAGIPRVVFLLRLADYGVDTFRLTEEELQRETRLA